MKQIFTLTLAALAILLAAIAPQSMEARASGGANSPGYRISNQTVPSEVLNSFITPPAFLSGAQADNRILTKGSASDEVNIGTASLPIPTTSTPVYYLYTETGGTSSLITRNADATNYNVAAYLGDDANLYLTFNNLAVTKTTTFTYYTTHIYSTTAAVRINYDGIAFVTLAGPNSLTNSGSTSSTVECYGLFCHGGLEINGNGSLTATVEKCDYKSSGLHAEKLTFNLESGGCVTAKGGDGFVDSKRSTGSEGSMSYTIKGGTVTSTGGTSNWGFSAGIFSDIIALTGGSVKASGAVPSAASESYGVASSEGNGTISITSGDVTIQGYTKALLTQVPTFDRFFTASQYFDGQSPTPYSASDLNSYKYLRSATVEGINLVYAYTGKAITPVPVVKYNGKTLTPTTDYSVDYADNTAIGTASVIITGAGDYAGSSMTIHFNIRTSFIYIGNAELPIPANNHVTYNYYTYSEASGNSVLTPTLDDKNYNVGIISSKNGAGKTFIQLLFKNLTVTKNLVFSNSQDEVISSAVHIQYSGITEIYLEGNASLSGTSITTANGSSVGLFSEGQLFVHSELGSLTATGGEADNSYGIRSVQLYLFNSDYPITATGGAAKYFSIGSFAKSIMQIRGGKGMLTSAGGTVSDPNGTSAGLYAPQNAILILAGIMTIQGHTNVTNGTVPKLLDYTDPKIVAGTDYSGSNAADITSDALKTDINTYRYLKIGSTDLSDAVIENVADIYQEGSNNVITPEPTVKLNNVTLKIGKDYGVDLNISKNGEGTITIFTISNEYTGKKKVSFKIKPEFVYIGNTELPIPTTATPVYYTYSETSGNSVLTTAGADETNYNVSAAKDAAGVLQLTFNNLIVTKSSRICNADKELISSAVNILYNEQTLLTIAGDSYLTGVEDTDNVVSNAFGLYSSGDIEFAGTGNLTSTGGITTDDNSIGIDAGKSMTINLSGGSITGEGGKGNSKGIYVKAALSITGNSKVKATGLDQSAGDSYGLVAGSINVALTGGSLTAAGGQSQDGSYGMISGTTPVITSGLVTIQGYTNVTKGQAPTFYKYAKVTAGANYDGTGAGIYDANNIGSYKFLQIGSTNLEDAESSITPFYCDYTGSPITPTLQVYLNEMTLIEGTDYTVKFDANTNPGIASVTITGTGAYSGTRKSTFEIIGKLSEAVIAKISDQPFTGSEIKPTPTVTFHNLTLTAGKDFVYSYENNTNIGTATITINPADGSYYTGSNTATFIILPNDLKDATVTGVKESYDHTGYQIKPGVTVVLNGKTLKEGTDYMVIYGRNTNPGTGTITIQGLGMYMNEQTITFTINEEPMTDYAYVNLPFVEGIKSDPVAGTYAVAKGDSFAFTLTLNKGYEDSKPVVTVDHQTITPNKNGEYVIENITENKDIEITGVTTGVENANMQTRIWTSGNNLKIFTVRPQQLQVITIAGGVAILRNIPAGDTTISNMADGIYIVRLGDGTTAKVIIR